jgi:glycosyltransferase involved in cell wall biosynthesis
MDVSVVICSHNPRPDYLHRTLRALDAQTLPKARWELLVVDNASRSRLADAYDLSWHPRGRHVHEDRLGLTPARLRGITETQTHLIVFVDDDNVLAPDFLEQAIAIHAATPHLGVYGAGQLEPEFEITPSPEVAARAGVLALRTVTTPRWSNNPNDASSIPWGAGLCVTRRVAESYRQFVERLGGDVSGVLDRKGQQLFSGGDDALSWVAASLGCTFGIFPELRITHLIQASRLSRRYMLRLLHDHAMSHSVLRYRLAGQLPRRIAPVRYVHLLLHGLRNGWFSMQCQWAASRGEDAAARFVAEAHLQPLRLPGASG